MFLLVFKTLLMQLLGGKTHHLANMLTMIRGQIYSGLWRLHLFRIFLIWVRVWFHKDRRWDVGFSLISQQISHLLQDWLDGIFINFIILSALWWTIKCSKYSWPVCCTLHSEIEKESQGPNPVFFFINLLLLFWINATLQRWQTGFLSTVKLLYVDLLVHKWT